MPHIYVLSDGTGQTAERVVRAALTRFDAADVRVTRRGEVRTAG